MLASSMFLLTIALMLAWFYRPYIHDNNIYDFHFADNILNLFFIPMMTLFFRGVSNKYSYNKVFIISTVALIVLELLNALLKPALPSIYTIVAIFLGALITFGVGKLFKIK